jgi:hypothetical protein
MTAVGVLSAALLILGWGVPPMEMPAVSAQIDPTSCGHFDSQADAQAALISGEVANPENLDPDGNGIACEQRWPIDPNSPPPVYDLSSCGHFDSQADAQAAFDAGEVAQTENLDPDGNGIVCELAFDNDRDGTTVTLPKTGMGRAHPGSSVFSNLALIGGALVFGFVGTRMRRVGRLAK